MCNNGKLMYEKMAKINGLEMETGIGQVLYDDPVNPTKRYFLEKRWSTGDKVLGAIMMNPSKAGNVESDETVNLLINYAKHQGYDALYVVNIIPIINSQSKNLKSSYTSKIIEVIEDKQIECFNYMFSHVGEIFIGWGKFGHEHFPTLLENKKIKSHFLDKSNKFFVTKLSDEDYPYHPKQIAKSIDSLKEDSCLRDVSEEVRGWINTYSF